MAKMSMGVRIRLSGMMFLQYMLIAVWFVQLTAYVKKLGMGGLEMALIGSSMALASGQNVWPPVAIPGSQRAPPAGG